MECRERPKNNRPSLNARSRKQGLSRHSLDAADYFFPRRLEHGRIAQDNQTRRERFVFCLRRTFQWRIAQPCTLTILTGVGMQELDPPASQQEHCQNSNLQKAHHIGRECSEAFEGRSWRSRLSQD